jgi:Calx-beta domain
VLAGTERSLLRLWHGTPDADRADEKPPATAQPAQSNLPVPPINGVAPSHVPRAGAVGNSTAAGNSAPAPALPHGIDGAALRSHVEFSVESIEVPAGGPAARVVVHRGGSLRGNASFSWWTEAGTANPGRDFEPVAPHEELLADGKSALSLFVPVVTDSTRWQEKTFYVVIGGASRDVSIGARHRVEVIIRPSR